ncbi:hypothetical protein ACTQ50_05530 [Blautia sp. Sow4_E7]
MTAKEVCRLIDWMIEHGHTEKEAIELVNFISEYKPVNDGKQKGTKE